MIIRDHMSVPLLVTVNGDPYDRYRSVSLIVGLDGKPLLPERPLGELYSEALERSEYRWKREYCGHFKA